MIQHKLIPLTILDLQDKETDLQEITKNKVSVIFGEPGSGKTALLKNHQAKGTCFLSIKNFLMGQQNYNESQVTTLLLDDIEEYRIVTKDTISIAEELGKKINDALQNQPNLKFVITCRESDYFCQDDGKIEEYINEKVNFFYIQPLEHAQQKKLANLLVRTNSEIFLKRFKNSSFLKNPQLFYMLSKVWNKFPSCNISKTELYEAYVKYTTKEIDEIFKTHPTFLSKVCTLKIVGYLSYFYFFCGVDKFEDCVLKDLSSEEYPYDLLNQIVQTELFYNRGFSHKMIAEFALAYHMVNFNKTKIEAFTTFFINQNQNVFTRLRGVYTWICSISDSIDLIKIDPYYQTIYGDSSLFDIKEKQNILKAIREYSRTNPYFIDFSQYVNLRGFYNEDLDDFLISEYGKAISLNNHYVFFLNYIIVQGKIISKKMEEFIKEKIKSDISYYYKTDLLDFFNKSNNIDFLRNTLNDIVKKKISDEENSLKDLILRFLYPKYITSQEIVQYLASYEETDVIYWHYSYLSMTSFDEKKRLIDEILIKKGQFKNKKHSFIPYGIYDFIKDFFFEVYIKSNTIQDIYTCLQYFHDKYFQYNKMEIAPFTKRNREIEKNSKEKLQERSNQLFEKRIRDYVGKNDVFMYDIYNFPYYFSPTNKAEVFKTLLNEIKNGKILGNIDEKDKKNTKKTLFFAWLNSLSDDEINRQDCEKEAQKNDLEQDYKEYLIKENQRLVEREKIEQEQQQKIKINLEKNENFFKEKTIEDLINNFGAMSWIAELYLYRQNDIERCITLKTFEKKLKVALQKILHIQPHPFSSIELTIEELSKQPQNSIRNIDSVYYASICVNNKELKLEKLDANFISYLYIVALWYENMHNMQNIDFCETLEKNNQQIAVATLKKYIALLTKRCFGNSEIHTIIMKHIEKETDPQKIKVFAKLHEGNDNLSIRLVREFLILFGFYLSPKALKILDDEAIGDANRRTVKALKNLGDNERIEMETALSIFSLLDVFPGSECRFQSLDSPLRVKILTYLMKTFSTRELLKEKRSASAMSTRDLCIWFLNHHALDEINTEELLILFNNFKDTVWEYKILHRLNIKKTSKQTERKIGEINEVKKLIA